MTINRLDNSRLLLIILAYGLLAMSWNLGYSAVFHDEALNISMGYEVLSAQYCPLCPQNTGSVMIHPCLAAIADSAASLYGARAVSLLFALGLTVVLFFTGSLLFSEKHGLLSALLFLFSGTVLYLSKLATYDMAAAFFLGLSFLLSILSEKQQASSRRNLLLFSASVVLFLAAITKYVVSVFVIPLLLFVFWRQRAISAFIFFFLPLALLSVLYIYAAVLPAWTYLQGSMTGTYKEGAQSFTILASRILRWIGLSYIVAVFGIFYQKRGRIAIALIVLSSPILFVHLLSGDGRSIDKNVIFALVFLSPAVALGVDQMGNIFSSNMQSAWVKSFFTISVLVVLWAFGLHQANWLERQYPDLTRIIDYFRMKGTSAMNVVIFSEYGDPDYIYHYSLRKQYPDARFSSTSHLRWEERTRLIESPGTDFVVLDEYYTSMNFHQKATRLMSPRYSLLQSFQVPVSWGIHKVLIYKKEGTI